MDRKSLYFRSGIIYGIFTLACLPSSALVAKLGVKTSLVLASVPYLLNILQLFTMNPGYIYFMAGGIWPDLIILN